MFSDYLIFSVQWNPALWPPHYYSQFLWTKQPHPPLLQILIVPIDDRINRFPLYTIKYTLAMSAFVFNLSILCDLGSKEFLSEGEEECSSCVRISVHSFSCCIPLTLLVTKERWKDVPYLNDCLLCCAAAYLPTSFKLYVFKIY